MKCLSLVLVLIMCSNAFAECKRDISVLQEGDSASCTGYLISPKMESYFNDLYEENDVLKRQIDNSMKLVNVYKEKAEYQELQVKMCQDDYKSLSATTKRDSIMDKITYFAIGALSIVIYKAIQK